MYSNCYLSLTFEDFQMKISWLAYISKSIKILGVLALTIELFGVTIIFFKKLDYSILFYFNQVFINFRSLTHEEANKISFDLW
jgi:hypothetical protein